MASPLATHRLSNWEAPRRGILADLFGIRAKYSKVNPPIALCPDPICKTPLLLRLLSLVFPVFHVCSTPRAS